MNYFDYEEEIRNYQFDEDSMIFTQKENQNDYFLEQLHGNPLQYLQGFAQFLENQEENSHSKKVEIMKGSQKQNQPILSGQELEKKIKDIFFSSPINIEKKNENGNDEEKSDVIDNINFWGNNIPEPEKTKNCDKFKKQSSTEIEKKTTNTKTQKTFLPLQKKREKSSEGEEIQEIKEEDPKELPKNNENDMKKMKEIIKKFEGKVERRTDYSKKNYKVHMVQFAKEYANGLLSKAGKLKTFGAFSLPNSREFTGNVKDSRNYEFLSFSVKDMFTLGKEKNGGSLQVKNQKLIEKILEVENLYELKMFLRSTIENLIELFEESKKYREFCDEEKTIYLDYYFQKEKGFSLRKKGGFLRLVKIYRH